MQFAQYEKIMSLLEDARSVFVFMSTALAQCHAPEAWCWNLRDTRTHSQSEGYLGIYDVTSRLKTRKIHGHYTAILPPIQAKLL